MELAPSPINTPTPMLPVGLVTLPPCNWTEFRKLPKFDIRNGDPSDVQSMLLKPTIPACYHWNPIAGLNPENGNDAMDGFIKSHMAQLEANPPPNLNETQRRKIAIVLGVARATMTSVYRLIEQDFIPGEYVAPKLNAYQDANGDILYTATAAYAENVVLATPLDLSDTEKAVISSLVNCATGIPPMQGYSLMMTGHHYLSDAGSQSRKVYAVAEKAYWKGTSVADWFNNDMAIIQDALWHKAGHPLSITVKTSLATNVQLPGMLKDAGAGACASRLPAQESELRAANSYLTLCATAAPLFGMYGGKLDFDFLTRVVETVCLFPVGMTNPMIPQNTSVPIPAGVTNRYTALIWLSQVLKRNADTVAFAYGFHCALSDASQVVGGTSATDTLRTSNSLSKLKTQSYASYVSGTQAFGDYTAARNAMRAKGEYDAPVFTLI